MWESRDKLVKKEIIVKGIYSDRASDKAVCTVLIEKPQCLKRTIKDMKENFHSEIVEEESSRKEIIMGEACSTVDRLIERAIQTMAINEKSLVTLKLPEKNTEESNVLSLEITLEAATFYEPVWKWSIEEKYESALKYKEKGVELFKAKRYVDAFHRFSKACKLLITLEPLMNELEDDTMKKNISNLKIILYNNMAECQLIQGNYEHTISLCNKVLSQEENNVKALYRRGVAQGSLRDFEKACDDLKIVISIQPNDKKVLEKYNFYSDKWRISVQGYENIVRKMFKS